MTATPLVTRAGAEPDAALSAALPDASSEDNPFATEVRRALETANAALERADRAERAFIRGRGGIQEMAVERAQAGIVVAVAAAAASRAATALTTILGMQV